MGKSLWKSDLSASCTSAKNYVPNTKYVFFKFIHHPSSSCETVSKSTILGIIDCFFSLPASNE